MLSSSTYSQDCIRTSKIWKRLAKDLNVDNLLYSPSNLVCIPCYFLWIKRSKCHPACNACMADFICYWVKLLYYSFSVFILNWLIYCIEFMNVVNVSNAYASLKYYWRHANVHHVPNPPRIVLSIESNV